MSSTSAAVSKRARIKARRNTVQALYQCFMTEKEFSDIIAEFESDEQKLAKTEQPRFETQSYRPARKSNTLSLSILCLMFKAFVC